MSPPQDGARPWSAGAVIGGRFRLVGELGAGAMGEVWRADHLALATQVAVKLIDLAATRDVENVKARFLLEARAAAQLKSAHVVRILDHGVDGRVAFIAMELLEGETLGDRLERSKRLAPAEVALIVGELAIALGHAHDAGIVHRDLKPQNVFLASVDGREVVKILDFGIAKRVTPEGAHAQTGAGVVVGTPSYMSPEQVMGGRVDWRSDLWQLGAVAFECLVGSCPFESSTLGGLFMQICSAPLVVPSTLAPVPPAFDAWFARALARAPAERFQSARELATTLGAILAPGLSLPMGATVEPLDSGSFAARAARIAEYETLRGFGGGKRPASRAGLAAVVLGIALVAVSVYAGSRLRSAAQATPSEAASSSASPPGSEAVHGPPAPAAEPAAIPSADPPAPSASGSSGPATKPAPARRPKRPVDELGI